MARRHGAGRPARSQLKASYPWWRGLADQEPPEIVARRRVRNRRSLGVEAAEVGQELGGQPASRLGSRARWGDPLEDPGGLPGADLRADAAGH
jgi:hypothetical protein